MNFAHISQADQRWRSERMNTGTMQEHGCLMCCFVALVSFKCGKIIDPTELDHYLDTHNGYLPKSDVVKWDIMFEWAAQYGVKWKEMKINQYRGLITNNLPIISEVLTSHNSHHYVVLLDQNGTIMDPGHNDPAPTTLKAQGYRPLNVRVLT